MKGLRETTFTSYNVLVILNIKNVFLKHTTRNVCEDTLQLLKMCSDLTFTLTQLPVEHLYDVANMPLLRNIFST